MSHDERAADKERVFWNERAREALPGLDPEAYLVQADDRFDHALPWLPFLGMPRLVDRLLQALGDLRGKRVLDLGTGTGFLAVLLALRGAQVIGIDVAGDQLEIARYRSRISGTEQLTEFREMTSETLDWPDAAFDAVTGSFILHHVDLAVTGREIRRVLRPAGGRGAFIETSGLNPLLMLCRDHLTGRCGIPKYGSPDERPLGREALRTLESLFPGRVKVHSPELLFVRMLSAYVTPFRLPLGFWVTGALDRLLGAVPRIRSYSYFVVVEIGRDV